MKPSKANSINSGAIKKDFTKGLAGDAAGKPSIGIPKMKCFNLQYNVIIKVYISNNNKKNDINNKNGNL